MLLSLTLIAFGACLGGAALLLAGTAYTCRLGRSRILAYSGVALAWYAVVLVVRPPWVLVSDASVLLLAVFLGSMLGTLVRSLEALAIFCIAGAVADAVSFEFGVTARIIRDYRSDASDALRYLCLSVPVHGQPWPVVGLGDLAIVTAIFYVFRRLGHRRAVAFASPVAGLLLAVGVGMLVGGIFAIPFIAATTLLYVWLVGRHARLSGGNEG